MSKSPDATRGAGTEDGVTARRESKYFWLIDETADEPGDAYVKARHKDTVSLRGER